MGGYTTLNKMPYLENALQTKNVKLSLNLGMAALSRKARHYGMAQQIEEL